MGGPQRSNNTSFFLFSALIAAGLEADRLLAVEGKKQSKQLKEGFEGIRHARSAMKSDQVARRPRSSRGCSRGPDLGRD